VARLIDADLISFLRAAVRSPLHVGAVAPSSRAVAEQMVAGLDFQPGAAVLELGPGTGSFTQVVAERLAGSGTYLGIERDEQLLAILRGRFPELTFVHGSAEDAVRHLHEAGHQQVQAIISGLPFASLPQPVQARIFDALRELMTPGVVFRAVQYLHTQRFPAATTFRRQMSSLFGPVAVSKPVFWNVPPAVVLSWTGGGS
jgi:phospholipid N-methyltransferase